MSPDKTIIQYSWVVNDLEAAARRWHQTMGIGPFIVNRHIVIDDPRYRGAPGGPDFSTAIAQSGGAQIELVQQHDDGPSCYRDTVPAGAEAMHHVAIVADDYDTALARYTDQGFAVAADGAFGGGKFCYVDTSQALGHMVEILENTRPIAAFFAMIARAAQEWDGDPETLFKVVSDSRAEQDKR